MQVEQRTNGTRRWYGVVFVLVLATALLQLVGLSPAGATPADDRSGFIAAINRSRAELRKAPPLRPAPDLDAVADRHAAAMADRGAIFHNPDLGRQVPRWESVGENVGVGPDVATLHEAFLASPAHRTNLLDDRYLEVGIGLAERDGHLWVVEVFRRELPAGAVVVADAVPAPVVPDAAALAATSLTATTAPDPVATPTRTEPEQIGAGRVRAARAATDHPSPLPLVWAFAVVAVLLAATSSTERSPSFRRPRAATA